MEQQEERKRERERERESLKTEAEENPKSKMIEDHVGPGRWNSNCASGFCKARSSDQGAQCSW
jgi:hypothetical protein